MPELPEPPCRCLVKSRVLRYADGRIVDMGDSDSLWMTYNGAFWQAISLCGYAETYDLKVIKHPGNDPEAIAMIAAAKKGAEQDARTSK